MNLFRVIVISVFFCHYFGLTNAMEKSLSDGEAYAQKLLQSITDEKSCLRISGDDFQYLLNLSYFSYLRSYLNCAAQRESLTMLLAAWHNYCNIVQTQRDPWHKLPFPEVRNENASATLSATLLLDKYYWTGNEYSHAVFNTHLVANNTKQTIKELREKARDIRINGLRKQKENILKLSRDHLMLLTTTASSVKESLEFFNAQFEKMEEEALTDDKRVTQLYIKTDEARVKITEQNWNMFMGFEHFAHRVWEIVENERVGLYKSCYNELLGLAQKINLDPEYTMIMFYGDGVIPKGQRTKSFRFPITP